MTSTSPQPESGQGQGLTIHAVGDPGLKSDIQSLAEEYVVGAREFLGDWTETSLQIRKIAWSELERGHRPTESELAERAGASQDQVRAALGSSVETDDAGRLVAVAGLSLVPTRHRISFGGSQLYTWCALDLLFFPRLMGRPAEISRSARPRLRPSPPG